MSKTPADDLAAIRSLMERSGTYRAPLAGVYLLMGACGLAAALAGVLLRIGPEHFTAYWLAVAAGTSAACALVMYRQARRAGTPLLAGPPLRLAHSLLPPLVTGAALGAAVLARGGTDTVVLGLLSAAWMALFGCGLCAASFVVLKGLLLLGWVFIGAGGALLVTMCRTGGIPAPHLHAAMGMVFGVFFLAYALRLRAVECPPAP